MLNYKIIDTFLDFEDEEVSIYHSTLKLMDSDYIMIGKNIDKDNFNNECFLVITTLDDVQVTSMSLNYVSNDGRIIEIEELEFGNKLRTDIIDNFIINL